MITEGGHAEKPLVNSAPMTPERQARIRQVLDRRQPDLTVVMDQVHKPHNLAAISRTCDAVGVLELHAIPVASSTRIHGNKAASGAGKWLPVQRHESVDEAFGNLRAAGFRLLAAHFDDDAVDYREVDYTRPTALVVGAELDGLSEEAIEAADASVAIPMCGMTKSLNVSVATALILYEAMRQRETAGMYRQPRLSKERYEEWFARWAAR